MALFNPQMSQAPSTFNPITTPADNTAANAINSAAGLLTNFAKIKSDSDEAAIEQASASAAAGLFSDTLRSEAEVIEGQAKLQENQKMFDQLYADGVISAEEQGELQQLQKDRQRLQGVTNRRQRQVQLRMKYANFVNRFPHLTKEARIMFGDADTRLDEVAQGAQGLVDQEAFESIYGKDAYTAENISNFRNLQKYKAQRTIGSTYGEANFNDWRRNFEADVTTEMFAVGQRMQAVLRQQGALRTEDIDTFNANVREQYMAGIKQIDQAVLELKKNGQYVSDEAINEQKQNLVALRDNMLKMSEGTDFTTRLSNLNKAMEEALKYQQNVEVGAMTSLFAGAGGGGAKGSADLMTISRLLSDDASINAAKNVDSIYGAQVTALQQNAAETIRFLDEYDTRASAQFIAPALARTMAGIQGQRIDGGLTKENPEALTTMIDLMEQGGTSDETVEGLLSRSKIVNQAAIKNNEAKARLSATVNNYALETQEYLRGINGRIRQTENGPEVVVSSAGGRMVLNQEGTRKLRNLQSVYKNIPTVGSTETYNSVLTEYTNERNTMLNEAVQELSAAVRTEQGVNTQLLSQNLRQLKIQFGLTDQEVAEISAQLRSTNGPEASGD